MKARIVTVLGDDISTDEIYPGRFMATVLPSETPQYAFADIPELNAKLNAGEIEPGSVILAGRNFGCGSSREQAASTLVGHALVIVANGFARIFLQNAINLGLRTITCPDLEAMEGDVLEIDDAEITNLRTGESFRTEPLPAPRLAIVEAGGLIPYTRERLIAERTR